MWGGLLVSDRGARRCRSQQRPQHARAQQPASPHEEHAGRGCAVHCAAAAPVVEDRQGRGHQHKEETSL